MTISTSLTTSASTYPVTVAGTSGSLSHSTTVSLIVGSGAVSGDFQLAVTQAFPANVDAGLPQTAEVSITPNYSGSITATCDASAMSGAQCTLTPANPVAVTANVPVVLTVALNVPNNTSPAPYNINLTVADASGQPSHTVQLPLTVIQDFLVTSSTPSQSVTAGQTSGPYNLTVLPVGSSFSGAVTLACPAGLPAQAQCLFDPSTPVTPGTSAVNIVMSISTTTKKAEFRSSHASIFYAMWLLVPGIVIAWGGVGARSARRLHGLGSITLLVLLTLTLLSCGGVSTGGGTTPPTGNQPVIYNITVTGTSPGTPAEAGQSTQVLLVVN